MKNNKKATPIYKDKCVFTFLDSKGGYKMMKGSRLQHIIECEGYVYKDIRKMKYKVGDKVRVKRNLMAGELYDNEQFVPSMDEYRGKVSIIRALKRDTYNGSSCYLLDGFQNWLFTDEMLEPIYTLQECIDKGYAIHCDTEEKSNKLMRALDSEGHKWVGGQRYIDLNCWVKFGKSTCYYPKEGKYAEEYRFKNHKIKIVYFDNVVLPKSNQDPILDREEKRYLEAVIRPCKRRVANIKKINAHYPKGYEQIVISVMTIEKGHNSNVLLPPFKKNSMYKGMELNKEYNLDELELFVK